MQKNFHIGKFFERARRRSLRLDITRRAIGVERSFLLWAPGGIDNLTIVVAGAWRVHVCNVS